MACDTAASLQGRAPVASLGYTPREAIIESYRTFAAAPNFVPIPVMSADAEASTLHRLRGEPAL